MIRKGFTLIELLVVIAVIGVLATILIVVINPADKLAASRDAGRKTTIAQLGNALKRYALANISYPPANGNWAQALVTSGEISTLPSSIQAPYTCWPDASGNNVNNYCYTYWAGVSYVWTRLESQSENAKCNQSPPNYAYYGYTSTDSRACLRCSVYSAACNATQ